MNPPEISLLQCDAGAEGQWWQVSDFAWHPDRNQHLSEEERMRVEHMLMAMSLCHEVIPTLEDGQIKYNAQSPDDAALVLAAASLGFRLTTIKSGKQRSAALLVTVRIQARARVNCST